jgi:hypothetical protein
VVEERLGTSYVARSEVASSSAASESRPATKSRGVELLSQSSRPTSGAMSPDVAFEARRPEVSEREVRSPRGSVKEAAAYQDFRRICDDLLSEAKHADDFLVDGLLSDRGIEVVVEVEALLDALYRTKWGEYECLKRIVLAIGSQLYNTQWTCAHVGFLKEVATLLRISYHVDDSLVAECLKLIRSHGLEVFRGTLTETDVRRKYRIVEAE